jgi:hypothetical protein
VAFGTINVVGGFLVTDRMLEMFKSKPKPAKAEVEPAGGATDRRSASGTSSGAGGSGADGGAGTSGGASGAAGADSGADGKQGGGS